MENTFENNQFEMGNQDIPDNNGMTDEEYEALLDAQIAIEFAKLDSKKKEIENSIRQANLKINQSINQTEKETEMNTQINTVETVAAAVATPVVENNTKLVAKKVAIILGKALAGAVVGGGLVVAGAHNHKAVNKAVKNARKRIGKVIPAIAPKPWWKF